MELLKTDVLIIGGGLAGLSAALQARALGKNVLILSKGKVGRSGSTIMARNNLAVVLDSNRENAVLHHVEDTLNGGSFLNDRDLVEVLANGAKEAVNWLAEMGVEFQQEAEQILVKDSPGHSRSRIISAKALSGKSLRTPGLAITIPLLQRSIGAGIKMLEGILVCGLINREGRVAGAYGLSRNGQTTLAVESGCVIMACGGAGSLYSITTNTSDITGDGYALAYQAGARVRDMEFVQFHPTVTLDAPRLVIATSVMGDGAVLRNRLGEEFMYNYSPQGNMATRDVMAQAIFQEIELGKGSDRGGVYLDLQAIPSEVLATKFPDIHTYLARKMQMEVAPAVHFMVGGIAIDQACQSSLPGLLACGEVAGGVHGANRLAGNALTEAVVFGRIAGRTAVKEVMVSSALTNLPELPENLTKYGGKQVGDSLSNIRQKLRTVMGKHVGLVRSTAGLKQAALELSELNSRIEAYPINSFEEMWESNQIRMMLTTAALINQGALKRHQSLGAHLMCINNSLA